MSRGRFIVWLDSDDYLEPGVLKAYAAALCECPKADVLYGRIVLANTDLEPVRTIEFEDWHRRNRELLTTLLFRCPLPHPGAAVARDCYARVGGYDPRFRRAHDYEFWSRLALKAVFKYVRRPVCRWRWHDANMSAGSVNIDTSYELEVLKGILDSYGLDKLFAHEDGCEKIAKLARRLRDLGDFALAAEVEKSLPGENRVKTKGNAGIGGRDAGG
jgi:glycosyltransferase involved in cell wall biosynthesis